MMAAKHNQLLEEVRHQYKKQYGVTLDDELIYLIIGINEMQGEVRKDIKGMDLVTFRTGMDYFWYGVGKSFWLLLLVVALLIGGMYFYFGSGDMKIYQTAANKDSLIVTLKGYNEKGDTTIYFTRTKPSKRVR